MKFNQAAKSNLTWSLIYFATPLFLLFILLMLDKWFLNGATYASTIIMLPLEYIQYLIGIYILTAIPIIALTTIGKMRDYE